jgi:hypothetical protein
LQRNRASCPANETSTTKQHTRDRLALGLSSADAVVPADLLLALQSKQARAWSSCQLRFAVLVLLLSRSYNPEMQVPSLVFSKKKSFLFLFFYFLFFLFFCKFVALNFSLKIVMASCKAL